ncbi:MAG TPA: CopD family protein [Methylomirabilota bacterium]|nr:CopD family protein [Methylomirabilota bacterium]
MAGFIDVLLRGLILSGQAIAVGGIVFMLWVIRPASGIDGGAERARRVLRLAAAGALAVAAGQALALLVQLIALADGGPWPLREVAATLFFRVSLGRIVTAVALAVTALVLRRDPRDRRWSAVAVLLAALLAVLASWTSHAAARPGSRALLLAADAIHQSAAFVWIGGLAHLLVAVLRERDAAWPPAQLARFSALALVSVGTLVAAGVGLSIGYIDGVLAFVGTAYGVMVLTKVVLLALLLLLGALNFRAVRRLDPGRPVTQPRLRRFVEVELGLGFTVLFAAASLTSLPPAIDVVADRATPAEVGTRFTPRLPTLVSPAHSELPTEDRYAERTDADRGWSEYNHHVAGLFVLAMGCLAILHATGRVRWAAYWPLLFAALAAFLLVRDDPGSWPLGPQGFWEGFLYADVTQHRVFVLIIMIFAVFETLVRTGRVRAPSAALVFPLLCAVGGGLLLTHSHASLNLKSEFLIEVTHAPLGVFGVLVGWGRWLELRLGDGDRWPGRVWTASLTMVGVLLIFYRES